MAEIAGSTVEEISDILRRGMEEERVREQTFNRLVAATHDRCPKWVFCVKALKLTVPLGLFPTGRPSVILGGRVMKSSDLFLCPPL